MDMPYKGCSDSWDSVPDAAELKRLLLESTCLAQSYADANPHVENTNTLTRKLKADLNFVELASQSTFPAPDPLDPLDIPTPTPFLTLPRVQGIVNNLQGFLGEYDAATRAPGVVAVSKKFRTVAEVDVLLARRRGHDAGALKRSNMRVEVDVVAQGGHTWIEVKNHESFGTDSTHWVGQKGHMKGLRQQVEELLQAAQAPCNLRRWQAPSLVVYFPHPVSPELRQGLQALGAAVVVGAEGLQALPPPPPAPATTNLCVTSLCALVSQVTFCDPHDPQMAAWAKGFSHWQECLEAEQQQPLLPALAPLVGAGRALITCSAAVQQFEELLRMWGGPLERRRWQELLARLVVLPMPAVAPATAAAAAAAAAPAAGVQGEACYTAGAAAATGAGTLGEAAPEAAAAACKGVGQDGGSEEGDGQVLPAAEGPAEQQAQGLRKAAGQQPCAGGRAGAQEEDRVGEEDAERVMALQSIAAHSKAVFALGHACRAVTLTANGNAVRSAQKQGVHLEAVVHRPVWLAGM